MALPGLSLPGLSLPLAASGQSSGPASTSTTQPPRLEELAPRSEWRFEVAFSQQYHIKVQSGLAEIFGVELASKQTYTFSGCKAAVFTWQGCQLEVSGQAESEYAGQETEYAIEWLNVHGMLETLRSPPHSDGPRALIIGPDAVGKSSLVRSLAAWGVKAGHIPLVLNLDSREGLLAPPSGFTAVPLSSQMDVENGYGLSPMSGPTVSPVRTPLIYHYPFVSPGEKPALFKTVITRMALSVMNKIEEDAVTKRSGFIIDTPGTLNDSKSNYDLIAHIVSEFSINIIVTMGSERLSSDMARRFGATGKPSSDEPITVLRVSKPGGAVERDTAFMRALRTQQIRQYFFGSIKESLNPHSHTLPFTDLSIFRAKSASVADAEDESSTSFGPGMDDDGTDDYDPAGSKPTATNLSLERITPYAAMTGGLVAIKFCAGASDESDVRVSAVMGFLYVAEVDETRKKVRFLAPHPQRWGDRALVWGHGWPEAMADLVA